MNLEDEMRRVDGDRARIERLGTLAARMNELHTGFRLAEAIALHGRIDGLTGMRDMVDLMKAATDEMEATWEAMSEFSRTFWRESGHPDVVPLAKKAHEVLDAGVTRCERAVREALERLN